MESEKRNIISGVGDESKICAMQPAVVRAAVFQRGQLGKAASGLFSRSVIEFTFLPDNKCLQPEEGHAERSNFNPLSQSFFCGVSMFH